MLRMNKWRITSRYSLIHACSIRVSKRRTLSTLDEKIYMKLALGPVERKPLVKELFIGNFDARFLTYPELLNDDQLDSLNSMYETVYKYISEKVDSKTMDATETIPAEVMDRLKEIGLFGEQIPVDFGGLGLTATEYVRINEAIGIDGALSATLAAHNSIGIKGILMYGTDEQKAKYLAKIASGEYITAFALTEPGSGSDAASMTTSARLNPDGTHYIVNGQKQYITNGGWADVLTVFARNDTLREKSGKNTITAFIVEKSFAGITTGRPESKLGLRASNTVSVFFDNVKVPVENVLGRAEDGFKLAVNILNSGRFGMGGVLAGATKEALNRSIVYAKERKQFGRPLCKFELIQKKIAQTARDLYAVEAMTYMTTAIVDNVRQSDFSLEAACVKVFASEMSLRSLSEMLQIHGGAGFLEDLPFERNFRDSRIVNIFEGTNEILRLLISLSGIQYAGSHLTQMIKIWRNPLVHPRSSISKLIDRYRDHLDRPLLSLNLRSAVHPSLSAEAQHLEYCIKRLQYLVEWSLQKHGKRIVERQMLLERIADVVIDIFAMIAVLARAARAHSREGVSDALAQEIILAQAFCYDARHRVKDNIIEALRGDSVNNANRYRIIAKHLYSKGQYDVLHPLHTK